MPPTDNPGEEEPLPGLDDFVDEALDDEAVQSSPGPPSAIDQPKWTDQELNDWYDALPDEHRLLPGMPEDLRNRISTSWRAQGFDFEAMLDPINAEGGDQGLIGQEFARISPGLKIEFREFVEASLNAGSDVEETIERNAVTTFLNLPRWVFASGGLLILLFLIWLFAAGPGSGSDAPVAGMNDGELAVPSDTVTGQADEVEEPTGEGDGAVQSPPSTSKPSGGNTTLGMILRSFTITRSSYTFTVEVDGDGQAMAEDPNTQWYNPRFTVTTPEGDFVIDGVWNGSPDFRGRAFSGADVGDLISGATVTGEWATTSMFVVVAENLGIDADPTSGSVELVVRITEPDGSRSDYEDAATWEP